MHTQIHQMGHFKHVQLIVYLSKAVKKNRWVGKDSNGRVTSYYNSPREND